MADIKCPSCGKTNPEALEICQYCGTLLKKISTEPLEPLLPGEFPVKKATSDLERTLPTWLREVRRAGQEPPTSPIQIPQAPQASKPTPPAPPPQEPPKKKAPAAPLDFLAGLSQAGEEEEEAPDWLKNIQGNIPAAPTPAAPEPAPEQSTDWLAELRDEPQASEPEPTAQTSWGFGGEPAAFNFEETAESTPQPAEETPDWLAALKAQEQAPAPSSGVESQSFTPAAEDFPAESGDVPDWLATLGGVGSVALTPEPETKSPEPQPAADVTSPDWLADLGGGFNAEPETPASESAPAPGVEVPSLGGDLPDWLAGLQETAAAPVQPAAPEPAPIESEPPAISGDLPDWLAGLQETPAAPVQPSAPEPAPLESEPAAIPGDLPDWLAGLQENAAPPLQPAAPEPTATDNAFPVSEPSAPVGDVPDWLASLQATSAAPAEPSTPEPTPIESDQAVSESVSSDLPDWLAAAVGEKPAETPPPTEEPKSKRPAKPFPTGELDQVRALGKADEVPDFMAGLESTTEEQQPTVAEPTPQGDVPDWLAGMAAGSGAAFLGAETQAEGEPEAGEPVEAEPLPFDLPAEKTEKSPSTPLMGEEQNVDSILSMEMPDWLSGFTPTEAEQKPTSASEAPEASDLSPVELPSWVQAMRPVESVIADTADAGEGEEIEQSGPLAGFRSILPIQPGLLETKRPKTYSIKLQVDQNQQAQAALLEQLLRSENAPHGVSAHPETLVMRPLRWIIAGVLFLLVLIPVLIGPPLFPSPAWPADPTDALNRFYETANGLPAGAPVLVVTDYQPGFAAEMESAAAPVLLQLMKEKNVRLAFLSTSQLGTYLSDRLVRKLTGVYSYQSGTQYVNLGYLPGNAAGIQAFAFAQNPVHVIGLDPVHQNLWATEALKDVGNFSSFGAVLIITDDPDNGRLWIEQAGKALSGKPMLMVISAQAGPMLQPYVASGQLAGLVTGLEGGVLYEQRANQPGSAQKLYWDGFGVATLAAALMLLVGGAWGILMNLRARRENVGEDED